MKEYSIEKLYKKKIIDNTKVTVSGWIKTNQHSSKIGFIELNDGSTIKNVQIVYHSNKSFFTELSKLLTGSSLTVIGFFKNTIGKQQPFEIVVEKVVDFCKCDNDYPLQKQKHSFEFLRDIAHIRGSSNTFIAVNSVRNVLSISIHKFLQRKKFIWIHNPIITSNDAEGAGENFKVFVNDKNFFNKDSFLTVSGQLHVEALVLALKKVFTFSPTFRAEKSNTTTHASEFLMMEPEIAFVDLTGCMKILESLLKFCITSVLKKCKKNLLK